MIDESKYLGGDMEHTHLVKGLDFALLQKVRSEITTKVREEDDDLEQVYASSKSAAVRSAGDEDNEGEFKSKMGTYVHSTRRYVQYVHCVMRSLIEKNVLVLCS